MGGMSITHWIIVLAIILVLFGGSKLGDAGRGLGEGIRNFKKGLREEDETPPPPPKQVIEVTGANKQLSSGQDADPYAPAKKKVIQVVVDDNATDAEIAQKIAEMRKDGGS